MSGRRRILAWAGAASAALLIGGCASKPVPAPRPVAPVQVPPPAPVPPPPTTQDPGEAALTPGDWSYARDAAGSEARYGPAAGFSLRCDSGRRRILIARDGAAGALRLLTSYGERTLPAGAALAAADPLLDEMAFSRGRFRVETDGMEPLVVPAWPEPARVIEDCRG